MTPAPLTGPLFDPYAFAVRVKAAIQRAGGVRAAEQASGISIATLSRASNGWAQLSHENFLRLSAWIDGLDTPSTARCGPAEHAQQKETRT